MNYYGMPGVDGSIGKCAICGETFLTEILLGKRVKSFNIEGSLTTMFGHDKCLKQIKDVTKWEDLPEGPLKVACRETLGEEEG